MKLKCFITVCAYLSSTVFTEEIKHLNRVKKPAKLREEFTVKDATAKREINPTAQIYPGRFPTPRQFQPQTRIEKFKRNPEFPPGSQQQQQQHNRDRSKHSTKRVKTRSVAGLSTYELNNNHLDSIPEVIHDEESIHIEPVFRVTRKKNVFDSIIDILHQLLDPPKELGPLVPIKIPGSKRKIYLRLIEPLDSSQVIVRFVTQLPVPVIDAEKQYNPFIPIPSIIDPTALLLNHAHHETIHPILSGDALLSSSSNRHHAIYPSRNISHAKGLQPTKPLVENSSQNLSKDLQDKENSKPAIALNEAESDKNRFTDTQVNLQNHEQQLLSESAAAYYQYQAESDEVMNKVKEFLEKQNATTAIESEGDLKNPSIEPWYQLSTHRLPLRQIASYPLPLMEHDSSSNSYLPDIYKAPNDVLTGPSSYSTSYEQYNDVVDSPPGFYPSSYSAPNSYSTYYKHNEIHDTHPNTYSTSYHKQNEFNSVPNSYSVSYQSQNEFNSVPGSYGKQNDLFSASSIHSSSYEKPTNVPSLSNSYEKQTGVAQTGANSNDAFQIVDPPSYLSGYRTKNHVDNQSFERTGNQQPRHNNPRKTMGSNIGDESASQVIWGKSKREKSESSFQKNAKIVGGIGIDDNEKWQPVVFVHENADWYETELAKIAAMKGQPLLEDRPTRKPLRGGADQARRNVKHRESPIARDPRCSTVSGEQSYCEQSKFSDAISSTPRSESTVKIEKQAQSDIVNNKSISIVKSASNVTETLKPNVTSLMTNTTQIKSSSSNITTKSPELMNNNKTTQGSSLLIKAIKNTTMKKSPSLPIEAIENIFASSKAERLIATEASLTLPMNYVMQKLRTSDKTEKSLINGTIEKSLINGEISLSSNKTKKLELPKRPMIMKKLAYILKRSELNSTTRRTVTTQKPISSTISSTTKRTIERIARKSKTSRTISKTKSSTT